MRALAVFVGVWWCVACVSRPELTREDEAQSGADGGADYLDASGPVRPPDLPASSASAARAGASGGPAAGFAGAPAGGQPQPVSASATQPVLAGRGASSSPSSAVPLPAAGASAPAPGSGPKLTAPSRPGQLVITEIMVDPKTLSDSDGEWFELQNVSDTAFDLQGCVIDDGAKEPRLVSTRLVVQASAYLTVARHEQPGFTPGYVATISFTNTADTLAVRCGEVEIDRVAYDKAQGFAVVAGASLSLDATKTTAEHNDAASAWCAARASYGPELGTPGQPNPGCDSEEDAGVDRE
jgi:hypothetical protein